MNDTIKQILEYAPAITWPVACVIGVYFTRDLWSALASRIRTHTDNAKITSLEQFRHTAETNHFTDLDHLLESEKTHSRAHAELWNAVEGIRKEQTQQGKDIAYIKGKIGNGTH